MTDSHHQTRQKLGELIKDIRFAMFTTMSPQGALHSSPMTMQKSPDEDQQAVTQLWFFMSRSSETASELIRSPSVNVTFSDPDKDAYVSISGNAHLDEDMALKKRLWSKMNEAWFPQGVDDPDLALVRVKIDQAEFWSVEESKPVQMMKIAKAAFSDEPPDLGTHSKMSL